MEIEKRKRRKKSNSGRKRRNTERLTSEAKFRTANIEKKDLFNIIEGYLDSETVYVIDIFPEQIPADCPYYEEVEQFLLEDIYKNFSNKCLSIILKYMCYVPYTNIVVNYYEEDGAEINQIWEAYSWYSVREMANLIQSVFLKNGSIHFCFEKIPMMIVMPCDDLMAGVYLPNDDNSEVIRILSSLVSSEGLFLRK